MADELRGRALVELLHRFAQRSESQTALTSVASGASATVTVRPATNIILYLKMISWDRCPPGVFDVQARGSIGVAAHGPFRITRPWIDHNLPNWEEDPPQVTNANPQEFVFTNQDNVTRLLQATIWWWELPRQIAKGLGLVREL